MSNNEETQEVQQEEPMTPEEMAASSVIGLMQASQNFYNEKADPDELDLVKVVREKLFNGGVSDDVLETCFDKSNFVQEAMGKHTHAQQWNITRWIDEQFTLVQAQDGIDTRLYRFQSVYEVKTDDWLKVFDHGIAPNLLEFGLRERK